MGMRSTGKGRRLLSGVLALLMCTTLLTQPAAAAAQKSSEPIVLESSRLDSAELPEGEILYFGTAAVTLEEGEQCYAVPVYREGDLSGEVSVDLYTVDLTAVYGKDYALVMDGVSKTGDGTTILKRYMDGAKAAEESQAEERPSAEEQEPAGEDGGEDALPSDSSLAQLKQDVTGEPVRAVQPTEEQSLIDSLVQAMVPDLMEQLDTSGTVRLTFAPGEDEKWVIFRLKDDHSAEGTESFSLMLADPVGAKVFQVASLAVTINDDEPVVHSVVSFTQARYDSENGVATVVVKRTGAEYSLVDMRIFTSQDTAEADVNYEAMDAILTFLPYETEKEVEFYVGGSGCFSVLLDDFTACQGGRLTRTKVYIAEGEGEPVLLTSDGGSSFQIKIDGKSYQVQYTEGDAWGAVVDTTVKPAAEVGRYYFALADDKGGYFHYSTGQREGDKPNKLGTLDCVYAEKAEQHDSYGDVAYLHTTTWKNGRIYTRTQGTPVPAVYYQFLVPDWASTSSYGGGQKFQFSLLDLGKSQVAEGKFDRTQSKGVIKLENIGNADHNRNTDVRLDAIDDNSNRTPKSYMRFYGAAAMYKHYYVTINNPTQLDYRTGNLTPEGQAERAKYLPFQARVNCGVQSAAAGSAGMNIYANPDAAITNLVFTLTSSTVGAQTGIFAYITGYSIQVGSGDKIVTLNYPEDFVSFLREQEQKRVTGRVADYSSSAVKAEIKKVQNDLETVPYDAYFIDWIDSKQTGVQELGSGYYQNLNFTPKVAYKDVSVTVLAPDGGRSGSFTAAELNSTGTKTFHAGDVLDLTAVTGESSYVVDGYQVSVTGGSKYNTITDSSKLVLEADKSYTIRPNLVSKGNHIEIEFVNGAQNYITVLGTDKQGTVPVGVINSNVDLTGKTVLNLNPTGSTAAEKIEPTAGAVYSIAFTGKTVGGATYRPVITDKMTGKVYHTNLLHFAARGDMEDNVLQVGYEVVQQAEWLEFTLRGELLSNYPTIRGSAQAVKHLAIGGYNVSAPQKQGVDYAGNVQIETASATTDENGAYVLSGIRGKMGDRITVLISNGGDRQIQEVVLIGRADTGEVSLELEPQYLAYPDGGPAVDSVTYAYAKDVSNQKIDVRDNSLRLLDDTLSIRAVLNTKGNTVSKVIFRVYNPKAGMTYEFDSSKDTDDNKDYVVFSEGSAVLNIKSPMEKLYNGDRFTISLVETQTDAAGVSYDIAYPEVDTGLVCYVQNEVPTPQTFEVADVKEAVNIPILGAASASASTGLLSFKRIDWSDAKGYTLTINLDALMYGTTSPGTAEKIQKVDALYDAAMATQKNFDTMGAIEKNIEDTTLSVLSKVQNGELSQTKADPLLGNLEYQKDAFDRYRNDMEDNARQPLAGFNQIKALRVDALFVISFDFIYNEEKQEYVFCCGAVAMGVTANYNKTIYTTIYGMPVFVNLTGSIQVDGVISYQTKKGEAALTAKEFDQYEGNLKQRLGDTRTVLNLILAAKAQAGAGMCGVLSVRGFIMYNMQFSIPIDVDDDGQDWNGWGVLVGATGGIGVDLLIASLDFNVGNFRLGYGIYEGKTEISFIQGAIDVVSSRETSVGENGGEAVTVQDYASGSADFSDFGGDSLLRGMPEAVGRQILMEDAADRTRPRMAELDDGRRILFFLGSRGSADGLNDRALYYSVCGLDGAWSVPELVADDGTVDASPTVLQKNGKVMVAWVDADRPYTGDDATVDKLNAMGISAAVYEDGRMSEEISLVRDEYFNFAPQLNLVGDTLYCSYMKRDLSGVRTDEDLLDFTGLYSTMAYVACDVEKREVISYLDRNDAARQEHFVTLQHPALTDPLVMDYQCVTTEIGGRDYMLAAYTVDEDEKLATSGDRELFLAVTDLKTGAAYYPIALTSDQLNQAEPRLITLNGTVYLTWLEEGSRFSMLDISELLEALFAPGTLAVSDGDGAEQARVQIDLSAAAEVYRTSAENGDADWYRKSAEELGLDREIYDASVYAQLQEGKLRVEQADFRQTQETDVSIGSYALATNGTDIYVFYTAAAPSEQDTGVELFGARYQGGTDGDDGSARGFGKSVQITEYGKVIDEFDLIMTEDNNISVVSNHYDQWIDSDGCIQYGPNQLVEIEFQPKGSLELEDITLPADLTAGAVENISFAVENQGLLTAAGFDVTVWEVTASGQEREIYQDVVQTRLDAGEECEVTIPWTIPASVEGMSVRAAVKERNVSIANTAVVTKEVPYAEKLDFSDVRTVWDGEQIVMTATVTNVGNKAAESCTGTLSLMENGEAVKTLGTVTVPGLVSGSSTQLTIPFVPAVEDFHALGYMNLQLAALGYGASSRFVPGVPVCAEINEGAQSISVKCGRTAAVTSNAAPWDGLAGEVTYTTDDPAIAVVDSDGTVHGVSAGTTTLRAAYGACGVADTITVRVTRDGQDQSGSSAGTAGESESSGGADVFTDVSADSYYYDAVIWAAAQGITGGIGNGCFGPDMACTRAQIVTFLWRAAGSPEPENVRSFADVPEDAYYAKAVAWAVENGITGGIEDGLFGPELICTRAQAVTFLYRNEQAGGGGFTGAWMFRIPFADVPEWCYEAVAWCYMNGITGGTGAATFSPDVNCTRAQIVTFLYGANDGKEL